VRGAQHIDESSQSDPILIREDGTFLYTLPSVVDDVELKVSHVIRGNDHVTNTATQIQIYEALGATVPTFAHLPLLVDASGEGLVEAAWARSRSCRCARMAWSRWRSTPISRGSAPAMRSSRCGTSMP
jgi:glutamyl-tRNA synthetase